MAFEPASRKEQHYVNRLKDRASYDEVAVFSAVDQCPVAHVTFKLPEEVDDYPCTSFY